MTKKAKNLYMFENIELKEFKKYYLIFQDKLKAIQNKISKHPMEQLFIDLFNNVNIKIIKQSLSICIFQDDKKLFQYDWKEDILWFDYDKISQSFIKDFKMLIRDFYQFLKFQIEKHFNFKPELIVDIFINY